MVRTLKQFLDSRSSSVSPLFQSAVPVNSLRCTEYKVCSIQDPDSLYLRIEPRVPVGPRAKVVSVLLRQHYEDRECVEVNNSRAEESA